VWGYSTGAALRYTTGASVHKPYIMGTAQGLESLSGFAYSERRKRNA